MSNIAFSAKTKSEILDFTLSTFKQKSSIAVLCDGEIGNEIIKLNRSQFVKLNAKDEYIIFKVGNQMFHQPAKVNDTYRTIEGMDYVVIVGDESKFNSDYNFIKAWVLNEA